MMFFNRLLFSLLFLAVGASAPLFGHKKDAKGDAYREGQVQGYEDGYRHGRDDYRQGYGYDPESADLKTAHRRYSGKQKGQFRKGYRSAYERGYQDGYGRRGDDGDLERRDRRRGDPGREREGRSDSRDREAAFDLGVRKGYEDGFAKGVMDRDIGRSADPDRHDWYRDADRGYRSDYGDLRRYQSGYRQGFEDGYADGYARRDRRSGGILDRIFGGR